MAASTIDRTNVTTTDDTGTAANPNGDGTLFQNSWVQAFCNAIDAMWSAATATFGGKLRVEGAGIQVKGNAAPAVSAAGEGVIYFDSTLNRFQRSENGGAYSSFGVATYVGTVANVSNTAVETTFATLSITEPIADGDVVDLIITVTAKNNTGIAQTPVVKLYFAAAAGVDIGQSGWSDNANSFKWVLSVRLKRDGADLWVVGPKSSTSIGNAAQWTGFHQDLTSTAVDEGMKVISAPSFATPISIVLKMTFPVANANLFLNCSSAKAVKYGS